MKNLEAKKLAELQKTLGLIDLLLNPDNIANSSDNELTCTSIEEVQDILPRALTCEDSDSDINNLVISYHQPRSNP